MSILLGGQTAPKAMYIGDRAVVKQYVGDDLVWESVKKYGGIPVYIDNANYNTGNHLINEYVEDTQKFVALCDTGSNIKHDLQFYIDSAGNPGLSIFLQFNDINKISIDWWNVIGYRELSDLTFRYATMVFAKNGAHNSYVYDKTLGLYLFKGDDV